jgi:hypothetical protein
MKKIAIVSFLSMVLFSCNKDCTPKTRLELLTAKTWKYDEYYSNYNNSLTNILYKRGAPSNSFNLDRNRVNFRSDGTYTEITETGQTVNGTWRFTNDGIDTEVTNFSGTYRSRIIILEENKFYWNDPSRLDGIFAKMLPQ